jgi:hypothetical protein
VGLLGVPVGEGLVKAGLNVLARHAALLDAGQDVLDDSRSLKRGGMLPAKCFPALAVGLGDELLGRLLADGLAFLLNVLDELCLCRLSPDWILWVASDPCLSKHQDSRGEMHGEKFKSRPANLARGGTTLEAGRLAGKGVVSRYSGRRGVLFAGG